MLRRIERMGCTLLASFLFLMTTGTAHAQGTIKIMYTDPLSGPFAQVGDQNLQQFKYIIDYINGRGGALGRSSSWSPSTTSRSRPSAARAEARHRPEHAGDHAVLGLEHRGRAHRGRGQAQRAEPRQPHRLRQLRRGGHRADQREVQLLALPHGRARRA